MMTINLLFVQVARPILKTKMISLWCNHHHERNRWKRSVNLPQNAELVQIYWKEKDVQSGETRRPHWTKMCQGIRVRDQKKSRFRARIQTVKLSAKSSINCWMSEIWETFIWSIIICPLLSSKSVRLIGTFQGRFMIFTSMWWRHAHSVIRRSRDLTDQAWADYEPKNLVILSSWIMDQPTSATTNFGFWYFLDGATSHSTAYPCESTSPTEVISKLHEWMDTFQMNSKAVCVDMAFHHPHDMQAFHRIINVERRPTGPHTPWPNRAQMGVSIVREVSLCTCGCRLEKSGQYYSISNHTSPVDA